MKRQDGRKGFISVTRLQRVKAVYRVGKVSRCEGKTSAESVNDIIVSGASVIIRCLLLLIYSYGRECKGNGIGKMRERGEKRAPFKIPGK
ncbi:hypothetical protein SDJN03_12994, partial [Cucurbita argyrosperma subsp. sororia]